jgi:hypothetical protein
VPAALLSREELATAQRFLAALFLVTCKKSDGKDIDPVIGGRPNETGTICLNFRKGNAEPGCTAAKDTSGAATHCVEILNS